HLAGAFDQGGQDVEGAAAEAHGPVALEQEPLPWQKPVRAKRDRRFVQEPARCFQSFFTQFCLTRTRASSASIRLGRIGPHIGANNRYVDFTAPYGILPDKAPESDHLCHEESSETENGNARNA